MNENTRAIILMNLGSPDSTEVKDVKRYLTEFLMDERVIDKPYLLRTLLVKGSLFPSGQKILPKHTVKYGRRWLSFNCNKQTTAKSPTEKF
jgi:protoheme ferro-lyase